MTHLKMSCYFGLLCCVVAFIVSPALAGDKKPADKNAKKQPVMDAYTVTLPYTEIEFDMLPIPGGTFTMGSPEDETDRQDDEGPQHQVKIEPFWMAKCEVTWDEYDTYRYKLDVQRRELAGLDPTEKDVSADAVTRPTKEYRDMTFGMGHDGFPAICMTQLSAKSYCEWLTEITGDYYRLPNGGRMGIRLSCRNYDRLLIW